jgi:alkylresorcinol/alkylpyrone synthase/polyketide synthase Type III
MVSSPRILAIGTANPPNRYSQREVFEFAARHVEMYRNPRIEHIFMTSDVDYRHFAFDLQTLNPNESADELHERFAEHSVKISKEAIERCLSQTQLTLQDIDYIVAVSCTGYLCPGLSAILIKEMGMRNDLQRADLIGMGCAGAMPGLQRAFDFVKAYPDKKALMIAVEICSACYYVDESLETVVGNAICGDGAAAVLVANHGLGNGPEIVQFETLIEPSFIDTVGFQFKSGKLRIVLSKDIRDAAGVLASKVINTLLDKAGLKKEEIAHWVVHSGGRKVIDNIKLEVGLDEPQMQQSRRVLKNFGNMSSPTVLFVLDETMKRSNPQPGEFGVMLAMGPGLAIEAGLIRW